MEIEKIMQDPVSMEIISLLMITNFSFLEKKSWVLLLPDMTMEQKQKLKNSLEKEVKYEQKVEQDALEDFVKALAEETPN